MRSWVDGDGAGTVLRDLARDDTPPIARPVAVARAYEQVAGQIKAQIVAGHLAPGERLPSESSIGEAAHVSRSTVREALRLLEQAGFVERASPRILVVRQPGGDEPALREATRALRASNVTFGDLTDALLALDPVLTRLATERVGDAEIRRLEGQLDEQRRALADPGTWNRLDDEFHLLIGETSGNAPLLLARRSISALLLPTTLYFVRDERMTTAAFTFHERMVEEMRAGDAEAAEFMTRKHINDFRRAWERAGLELRQSIGELV